MPTLTCNDGNKRVTWADGLDWLGSWRYKVRVGRRLKGGGHRFFFTKRELKDLASKRRRYVGCPHSSVWLSSLGKQRQTAAYAVHTVATSTTNPLAIRQSPAASSAVHALIGPMAVHVVIDHTRPQGLEYAAYVISYE